MQRILSVLIVLSIGACRTSSSESTKPSDASEGFQSSEAGLDPRSTLNVQAEELTVKVNFKIFSRGKIRGIKLEPIVDNRANYISYEIVSLDDPAKKIYSGTISGLAPEIRFDLPTGHLKISYQACVLKSRAAGDNCTPKVTDRWVNAKVAEDSSEEGLKTKQILTEYQKISDQIEALPAKVASLFTTQATSIAQESKIPEVDRKAFADLMTNYLVVDPYVLGDFYNSGLMGDYFQNTPKEGDATWSTALLLNFANPDFINEQWNVFIESSMKRWDLADRRLQRPTSNRPSFQTAKPPIQKLKPVAWDSDNLQMQTAIARIAGIQIAQRLGQRFGITKGTALKMVGTYIVLSWALSVALDLADSPPNPLIQDLEKIGEEFASLLKSKNEKLAYIKSQLGE